MNQKWTSSLRSDINNFPSLNLLNPYGCRIGQIHPVWQNLNCPLDIEKATVKAQLLIGRYPLSSCRTSGYNRSVLCPLCQEEEETATHFLLNCPALEKQRSTYIQRIITITGRLTELEFTKVLLDSTYIDPPNRDKLESLTRNMIFKLAYKRGILMGGPSIYVSRKHRREKGNLKTI